MRRDVLIAKAVIYADPDDPRGPRPVGRAKAGLQPLRLGVAC
jgi:hypothetical protein